MIEQSPCKDLASVLEAQIEACQELIALSEQEQRLLLRNAPQDLAPILAAKGRCAQGLVYLEASFHASLADLREELRLAPQDNDPCNLHDILSHLATPQQSLLEDLWGSLRYCIKALGRVHRTNALIVQSALGQADALLCYWADATGVGRAYGSEGEIRAPHTWGSQALDREA